MTWITVTGTKLLPLPCNLESTQLFPQERRGQSLHATTHLNLNLCGHLPSLYLYTFSVWCVGTRPLSKEVATCWEDDIMVYLREMGSELGWTCWLIVMSKSELWSYGL
jgi:hypothetical protein